MVFEKLLGDETRRKILEMTSKNEMTVTEIARELKLTKATVSHHIKLLSDSGLMRVVRTEISGNFIKKYYRSVFGDTALLSKAEKSIIHELKYSKSNADMIRALLRGIGVVNVQVGNELFLKKIGFDIGYHYLADLIEGNVWDGITELWKKFNLGEVTESGGKKIVVEECYFCEDLPYTGYTYCRQDEGIIEGILLKKFERRYLVKEVECWGTGSDRCIFEIGHQ